MPLRESMFLDLFCFTEKKREKKKKYDNWNYCLSLMKVADGVSKLHPPLGLSAEERPGSLRVGPEDSNKNDQRAGTSLLWRKTGRVAWRRRLLLMYKRGLIKKLARTLPRSIGQRGKGFKRKVSKQYWGRLIKRFSCQSKPRLFSFFAHTCL